MCGCGYKDCSKQAVPRSSQTQTWTGFFHLNPLWAAADLIHQSWTKDWAGVLYVHCSHEPVSDWLCSQDRVKSIFTSHLLSACGVKMPVFCFHLRTSIEFVCFEKKNTHLSICFSGCFALMMYSNWPQIFVGIRNAVHSRAFSTLSEPSHVWLALWYRRKDEKHRSSEWWTLCTGTKTRLSPHQKQSCIYTVHDSYILLWSDSFCLYFYICCLGFPDR